VRNYCPHCAPVINKIGIEYQEAFKELDLTPAQYKVASEQMYQEIDTELGFCSMCS
jgi:DNA/RNA-binding domain of Phe-tRNA-synthetase-like protein